MKLTTLSVFLFYRVFKNVKIYERYSKNSILSNVYAFTFIMKYRELKFL